MQNLVECHTYAISNIGTYSELVGPGRDVYSVLLTRVIHSTTTHHIEIYPLYSYSALCPVDFRNLLPHCMKVMKVRLQPPSGTDLPAFNPVLPPAAITQILLLANPQQVRLYLRWLY